MGGWFVGWFGCGCVGVCVYGCMVDGWMDGCLDRGRLSGRRVRGACWGGRLSEWVGEFIPPGEATTLFRFYNCSFRCASFIFDTRRFM